MRARTRAAVLLPSATIMAVAVVIGNVHGTRHVCVIDVAAAFVLDAEILADPVHVNPARAVVTDDYGSPHVSGIDPARAVALDDEGAGNIAHVDIARAIVDAHITANVLNCK